MVYPLVRANLGKLEPCMRLTRYGMARPKTQRQPMNSSLPHQLSHPVYYYVSNASPKTTQRSVNQCCAKAEATETLCAKRNDATDADIDATVADAAAPKASSSRKTSNSAKPPAVTTLPAEQFVPLHQAEGPGLYTSNRGCRADSGCFIRWHQR